jgi:hypothetical protein
MTTATIFSWVLAAAPVSSPPTDKAPPRADVMRGPDWARVLTYDTVGEVSAEMVVWSVDDEIRVIEAWMRSG